MVRAAILLFAPDDAAEAQRLLLTARAREEAWTIVREFGAPSGPEGLAGRHAVFQELLAEAQLQRIDKVLMVASSAALAAPGEIGALAAALRLTGVDSISVDAAGRGAALDPGAHLEDLLRFASNLEAGARRRARTTERSEGRRRKVLQGGWAGGRPPYGFRLVDDPTARAARLAVDPKEAAVVREIFRLYSDVGLGSSRVAEELNRLGERLRSGGPWNDSAVRAVLRSPMAAGRPAYGRTRRDQETGRQKRVGPGAPDVTVARTAVPEWEIVDFDTFRRAQDRLQERRSKSPPRRGKHLLLSGLSRCGHCGGPLTAGHAMPRRKLKDGTIRHYRYARYDCRTRAGGGLCTGHRGYPAPRAENVVLSAVPLALARLRQVEVMQVVRQRIEEASWRQHLAEEKALRRARQAEEAMARLYRAAQRGITPDAERIRAIARREAEVELVTSRADAKRVRAAQPAGLQMQLVEAFLMSAENWWAGIARGPVEARREALGKLVGSVIMSRTGIEICWQIDLGKLAAAHDAGSLAWTERLPWPPTKAH